MNSLMSEVLKIIVVGNLKILTFNYSYYLHSYAFYNKFMIIILDTGWNKEWCGINYAYSIY